MKRPPGLIDSEWATYQSLRDRGFSHNVALNDALDGVSVETLRESKIKAPFPETKTGEEDG